MQKMTHSGWFQEGLNNEKFDSHPSSPEELPAYLRVHNPWYHGLDLLASLLLILLAFTEDPAVPAFRVSIAQKTLYVLCCGNQTPWPLDWPSRKLLYSHARSSFVTHSLFFPSTRNEFLSQFCTCLFSIHIIHSKYITSISRIVSAFHSIMK